MASSRPSQYAAAGVDIAHADRLLARVKPDLKKAVRPESLGSIGGFGGFFDISGLKQKHPVLVSSTDSVGTKVTAARLAGNYRNLGADIVNHCANDIAVCGAEPLYFLDYYATGKLNDHYVDLMRSLAKACVAGNIALVGGETAELPGVYQSGECDLVGTIVGVVDKPKILTGEAIRPGDVIIGLPSSGLHTNGFSLARKVLFETLGLSAGDTLPGGRGKVGNLLLKPHLNYAPFLLEAYAKFNQGRRFSQRKENALYGVAHLTGGGFKGNIPRVLPEKVEARIETGAWRTPSLFQTIVDAGKVEFAEAYEVFNMGIGMALIVDPSAAGSLLTLAKKHGHRAREIGAIANREGEAQVKLVS